MKKKLGVMAASILLLLSLFGCSSEASNLDGDIQSIGDVSAESWDNLQSLNARYEALDDSSKQKVEHYAALQDAIEQCTLLKNEQEFLNSLEQSILWRMDNKDDPDRSMLVDTELAALNKYRETPFANASVAAARDEYMNGLDIQKEALGQEYKADIQIGWQKGAVARYGALKSLYETCGLLSDNSEFVGSYVNGYEAQSKLLAAYETIEADIDSQVERIATGGVWTDYSVSFEVNNNTDYQYDSMWECSFKNEAGTVTENASCYVENVKPHSRYTVTFYFTNSDSGFGGFDWNNYYANVVV